MHKYDLEERILRSWAVVDDLQIIVDQCEKSKLKEDLTTFTNLLNYRFQDLFSCYETLLKEKKFGD